MKNNHASIVVGLLVIGWSVTESFGQGMPAEARKNIHLLFNRHEEVTRTVTMTKDGYVALTESNDPKVAAALREHVRQMEARLKDGLMVRRHDPAFVEFAQHYDDIRHSLEATDKGLKVVVSAKTPAAIKVAQNHATVVTDFATHGWEAHDRDHAPALRPESSVKPAASATAPTTKKACPGCCENGTECQSGGSARTPAAPKK